MSKYIIMIPSESGPTQYEVEELSLEQIVLVNNEREDTEQKWRERSVRDAKRLASIALRPNHTIHQFEG